MSTDRDRPDVTRAIVVIAAISLVALVASPVLAPASTNGGPGVTPNWWIVLIACFAGTLLVQAGAVIMARRAAATAALLTSLLTGWVVVAVAAGVIWVSVTLLTLGIALIAQQIGRRPSWVLAAQAVILVVLLAVLRDRTVEQIGGTGEPTPWERLLQGYVLIAAATAITWQTWAQDERLARLAGDLRSSRLRLVEAGDAARRALERDLHDGAQQRVVTASLNLATTRRLITTDPERADSMIAATMTDLHHAAAQLRDVSHGIYPAELTRDGLDGALHALSRRAALPVTIDAHHVGRLSPEIEAAIYFCCAEAVQNASKHAGPDAHLMIRVERATAALTVTITDDGNGFDPTTAPTGQGLTNMHDRIGAIGGTLTLHTTPGTGTTIHATIHTEDRSERDMRGAGRARLADTGPSSRRRAVLGVAAVVVSVAAYAVSYALATHVITTYLAAQVAALVALALVAPLVVALWRQRGRWHWVVAGLITWFWLDMMILALEGPTAAPRCGSSCCS